MTRAEDLAARLGDMADEAREIGSPFYGGLCEHLAADAAAGGPTLALLGPTLERPVDDYHVFRVLAGIHWLVLEGAAPELVAHHPSVGGDGDADAAWPHVLALVADPPDEITAMLEHPLQTNEPARSAALVVGLLEVAARTGLPLRLLELGASAGLNLHLDRFRFEAAGRGVGPPDSPVCFREHWREGTPRFDAGLDVVDRLGCDLYPVDLRRPSERTRLLAFVWPDEHERFALLRAAVDVASSDPVVVEQAPLDVWLDRQLGNGSTPGSATVVFHSLVWMYLDEPTRSRVLERFETAGRGASEDAPLAWLRYEQEDLDKGRCDLRLTVWPEGDDRLLAWGGHHDTPVTILPG